MGIGAHVTFEKAYPGGRIVAHRFTGTGLFPVWELALPYNPNRIVLHLGGETPGQWAPVPADVSQGGFLASESLVTIYTRCLHSYLVVCEWYCEPPSGSNTWCYEVIEDS